MNANAVFAFVLALAAILACLIAHRARGAVRGYLRFAAILYLALAIAQILAAFFPAPQTIGVVVSAIDLVSALAPVCLALSIFSVFEHPPPGWLAAIVLLLGGIGGLFASVTAVPSVAFAVLFASVCAMLTLSIRRLRKEWRSALDTILASVCLIAGAACSVTEGEVGRIALALFSAAGLLGIALGVSRRSNAIVKTDGGRDDMASIALRR